MPLNSIIQRQLLLVLLLPVGLTACNKLLDVPPPPNELGVDGVFRDSASAVSAIASIYKGMVVHGSFEWSGLSFFTARSADDALYGLPGDDHFAKDSLLYTDFDLYYMWEEGFNSLLMINTCLKGLQSHQLSATLHNQLQGEALFCRAFVNFYLVNIWGDAVPLLTSPDINEIKATPSVPRQRLYEHIISDLLQAQALLTNRYAGEGRVRANQMAVNALLARVYLYQGRYADAIAQANTVINSNLYTPLPSLASTFLQSSKEAIWQLMAPVKTLGDYEPVGDAKLYQGYSARITRHLLAAFEPDDGRRLVWVADSLPPYTYSTTAYKYKRFRNPAAPMEYYIVLRLAEQYLIRAEAATRLGQTQSAIADLNVIRKRAGLPGLSATLTQAQCMRAVEQERQVELFTEWGHRWFDLKRWPGINDPHLTRADEVLGAIKPDWQSTDQWYPVPRSGLSANPLLVQNPGYAGR